MYRRSTDGKAAAKSKSSIAGEAASHVAASFPSCRCGQGVRGVRPSEVGRRRRLASVSLALGAPLLGPAVVGSAESRRGVGSRGAASSAPRLSIVCRFASGTSSLFRASSLCALSAGGRGKSSWSGGVRRVVVGRGEACRVRSCGAGVAGRCSVYAS